MTAPDVPLRMELTVELPGTPDQVWQAIATADGISAWFLPTDLEERDGGAVRFYMGEDGSSAGTVTGWEPPHRLAYAEPDWAALAGHEGAPVTPLVSEFLVEAQSGGTCVVRVVSSAFGTGADWEREFFADVEKYWRPYFDHLRLYLTRFPGQRATSMSVRADLPGSPDAVLSAIRENLGAGEVGQPVDARGIAAYVEQIGDVSVLLRLADPQPGYLAFFAIGKSDDTTTAQIVGYLFSADAREFVDREGPAWQTWLDSLGVAAHR